MLVFRKIFARIKFVFATKLHKKFTPTCNDFVLLNKTTQLRWISRRLEDYEQLLYKPEAYLGLSYPVGLIDLEEYRLYSEDYNVVGLLIEAGLDITPARKDEINSGAHLYSEEAKLLIQSLAGEDTDSWVGHHGFEIKLSDGTLFTHFEGHSMGQGGVQFELCQVLQSKRELIEYIESQPLSMLEM